MRNRRNVLARVPPELLANILLETIELQRPDRHLIHQAPSWKERVQIRSVCRTWRQVAREAPEFRTCIALPIKCKCPELTHAIASLPERFTETTRKTRGKPLRLRLCLTENQVGLMSTSGPSPQTLPARTQELHVHDLRQFHTRTWCSSWILDHPIPVLLSLRCQSTSSQHRLRIPRALFTTPLPMLRTLVLENCSIDWEDLCIASPFASLTNLVIVQPWAGERIDERPSIQQLFTILSAPPRLKSCRIEGSCPNPPLVPSSTRLIPLASLEELKVLDNLHRYAILISSLESFPSTASVFVTSRPAKYEF